MAGRRHGCRWSSAAVAALAALSGGALALPEKLLKARWRAAGPVLVGLHRQVLWLGEDQDQTANAYFGTIALGYPNAQNFAVVFDTGSGHVVVPSHACESSSCQSHRSYDSKASLTAEPINAKGLPLRTEEGKEQVTVEFGTGEITGEFVREVVRMGRDHALQEVVCLGCEHAPQEVVRLAQNSTAREHTSSALELVQEMHVVTAVEMSSEPFEALAFDGIFGLGLDALAVAPGFSFLGQLAAKGGGLEPQFGLFLAATDEEQSEIAFGGYNLRHLRTPLTWAPVVAPELGHWQVAIRGVRLGNRSLGSCGSAGGCHGVVDSGTSALGVPAKDWEAIGDALCEAISGLAASAQASTALSAAQEEAMQLHLDLDGVTLSLDPEQYAWPAGLRGGEGLATAGDSQAAVVDASAARGCRPKVIPLESHPDLGGSFLILGEPVLRRYYTVFDRRGPRIGFGEARHRSTAEEPLPQRSPHALLGEAVEATLAAIAARRAAAAAA